MDYALQLYRDHVQAVGKTSPYLAHPLPADTPDDIREMTQNLGELFLIEKIFLFFFLSLLCSLCQKSYIYIY